MMRWTFYRDAHDLWRWKRVTFGLFVFRSDRGHVRRKDCMLDAVLNGWSEKWPCDTCGADTRPGVTECPKCQQFWDSNANDPLISSAPDSVEQPQASHGHSRFTELLAEEGRTYEQKNHDYSGGQGRDPMGNFQRVSTILGLYPGFDVTRPSGYAMVLMLKQVDATLMQMTAQHESLTGEGLDSRLLDVSVYAKLIRILHHEEPLVEG